MARKKKRFDSIVPGTIAISMCANPARVARMSIVNDIQSLSIQSARTFKAIYCFCIYINKGYLDFGLPISAHL